MFACVIGVTRTRNIGIKKKNKKKRHLLCMQDTDDVTQKKKGHEIISSRFFTERKTERSFVGHLSLIQEVLTKKQTPLVRNGCTVAYYLHKVSVKNFMHKHLHLILGGALAPRQKFSQARLS